MAFGRFFQAIGVWGVLGGSGANGTARITPAAGQNGLVTITLTVRDSGLDGIAGNADDATASDSFVLTVIGEPENQAPVGSDGAATTSEGSATGVVIDY